MNIYIPVDFLAKLSAINLLAHAILWFFEVRYYMRKKTPMPNWVALVSIIELYLAPITAIYLVSFIFSYM